MIGLFRGRSRAELALRLRHAAAARLDRAGLVEAARLPDDDAFLRRLGHGPRASAAVLERFRASDVGRIFPALQDPAATSAIATRRWPDRAGELLARADRLLDGRFDLLGHEGLRFGDPVDWHLDPVSGTRAPRRHWSRLDPLDARTVGDHKVIWELNRHQYFVVLARAWLATCDSRHARLLVAHLAAWMRENEPKRGINWGSSLELAYRSIAWIWALNMIRGSDLLEPPLFLGALKHLWVQGRHVEAHLSTYFSPNTHLTGEALGLLYLGSTLPELPDAERWRRLGWQILMDQVDRHALPDGTYFERASYYHRYTVDIYTHALLLGRANRAPAADLDRVEAAVQRLLDHMAWLTRPDGTSPLIGDDDGGHLWFPDPARLDDFRPSLSNGAALFQRPDLAQVAGGPHEETLWLLGRGGLERFEGLTPAPPARPSRAFHDGGYYVMRDGWSRDASMMVLDAGPLGALNCGHAHADALAFDLTVRGVPVLVDPGTFSYVDATARDAFRAGPAHNTVSVAGAGSSEPGTAFQWRSRSDAECHRWLSTESFDYLAATHTGFRRIAVPGEHRREVWFARGEWWLLRDTVRFDDPQPGALTFQLAPGLEMAEEADGLRVVGALGAVILQLYTWCRGGSVSGRPEPGWVSRAYGSRARASRWVLHGNPLPKEVVTLLVPGPSTAAVRVEGNDDGVRIRFEQEGVGHLVWAAARGGLRDELWDSDARWLWVRQDEGESHMDVRAMDISTLSFRGRPLLADEGRLETFEARVFGDGAYQRPRRSASELPRSPLP